MAEIRSGDTVGFQLPPVRSLAGLLVNADALPTCVVVVDGNNAAVVATPSIVSTGIYRVEFTAPNDWDAGAIVQLRVSLTVGGLPVVETFDLGQVARPLADGAITDATFGWSGADVAGVPATVLGRLRRFISEWFSPRDRNRTTGVETSFAADGVTPLHKRTTSSTTTAGVTTDRVTVSNP